MLAGHAHFADGGAVGWVTHALAVSEAGMIEHDGATRDSLVLMAGSEEYLTVVAAWMTLHRESAELAVTAGADRTTDTAPHAVHRADPTHAGPACQLLWVCNALDH